MTELIFSDFSSNRDQIYLQNIQIFAYIIDMTTLLCNQDQKSFLLTLTLMKNFLFPSLSIFCSSYLLSNIHDF